jgi:hypothetical protein
MKHGVIWVVAMAASVVRLHASKAADRAQFHSEATVLCGADL